jgi:hypothetical protein
MLDTQTADAWALGTEDLLGRRAFATALADKLYGHVLSPKHLDPGPTVVTIEGPWGCGKSTLMDFVRQHLPAPPRSPAARSRLTVREASVLLRNGVPPESASRQPSEGRARWRRRSSESDLAAAPRPDTRGVVSAWFNPWAHQSGEQVWAGLVAEIIEAAQPVLYPTEQARERYWFARNLGRVDRYALRRTLHRRTLSPALTLGALGVVASMAIAIAEIESTVRISGFGIQTAIIALMLSGLFLLGGGLHTLWRFLRGSAVRFLPGELFHGPVGSSASPDAGPGDPLGTEGLTDPLRRARAGSLYLHQHHVSGLLNDLDRAGYELIVFVDDLDRCQAQTTAEVFEAINLFLAGFVSERRGTSREIFLDPDASLRARFVIGIDPVVVAGHLDKVYEDVYDRQAERDSDDPSPGWSFLRKLVHLPIVVPQVSDVDIMEFIDRMASAAPGPALSGLTSESAPGPARAERAQSDTATAWLAVQHSRVRELIAERFSAQPDRSVREAMRQLNLCQFYERVLAALADGPADATSDATSEVASDEIDRSRHLIILAEIISRWPSLQRHLHRRRGERTGLQTLASAADDDRAWAAAAPDVVPEKTAHKHALAALRELLIAYEGREVASLAARLL